MFFTKSYIDMKILKSREIVIEYEKLQLIRKRARTQVVVCPACRAESDFVSLTDAAELFNTAADVLTKFITDKRCHFQADASGAVFVCLASLMAEMREQIDDSGGRRMVGESH